MEWIVLKFAADFNNDDALSSSHFRCVCVFSFVCVCVCVCVGGGGGGGVHYEGYQSWNTQW